MRRATAIARLLLGAGACVLAALAGTPATPSSGATPEPGAASTRAPATAAAVALSAPLPRNASGYRLAVPPWAFEFPRDHAAHPDFQTEWWYYTGHLAAGAAQYGYELTFFRVGLDPARRASPSAWAPRELYFAHLALTDVGANRFRFDERISRGALGLAGADSTRYHVWIESWSGELATDGITHRLAASTADWGVTLDLKPLKPPAIHGADGVSQKSEGLGHASHYYSLTRLATTGTLTLGGRARAVTGQSWMDHEFSSGSLGEGLVGWDWFSVQLDDGRELMLYAMRRADGTREPHSSGTLIARDGRTTHLALADFTIEATGTWKSPRTGAEYPSGWIVRVPREQLELTLTPLVADQELATTSAAAVTYWEGAVRVAGSTSGRRVGGEGYVELTGYAGRTPGF